MDEWLIQAMATATPEAAQSFMGAHGCSCGFVIARPTDFDHLLHDRGPVAAMRRVGIIQGLLEAFGPKGVRRESEMIVALVDTREQALHLGLTLAQFRESHPVSIAVGAGEVLVGPDVEVHGSAIQQVRKLVMWARPHELLISRTVLEGMALPKGVGIFSAPEALDGQLGFSAAILRDFRGATPV